jgi:hypothetical protein
MLEAVDLQKAGVHVARVCFACFGVLVAGERPGTSESSLR